MLLRRANIITQNALLDEVSDADLTQAEAISESLGGLPLGLDQAGAYIEETSLGLSGYFELYQTQQRELLQRRGKPTTGHPEPVITTWSLSFAQVEQANGAAADLLRLCAFLYPDAIPEGILNKKIYDLSPGLHIIATETLQLNEAIEELLKFSLVRRDPHARTLTLHRLVQTALKEGMDKDTQCQWAERAVHAVSRAFPEVEFSTWLLCQQYLPHALRCRTLIEQWNMEFPEATDLLYKAGYYLWDRSQYADAEPLLECTLAIREKVLGSENLEVAQTLNLLGVIYQDQDKYAQAEPLLQRALAIREKILGQEDPKVAESLNDLGMNYDSEGKILQAEPLLQRAVAIRKKVLGLEHLDTAISLGNLGRIYLNQAKYMQAEQLARQTLVIREKLLGQEHPDTATALCNLASVKSYLRSNSEAEQLVRQSLAIREKLLGREHPDTAFSLNILANILFQQGKLIQAKTHAQRALSITERTLGPKHHLVASCLEKLALIFEAQHNYRKAESFYTQALGINEKILGQEHPFVAEILTNLGDLYKKEGKYSKSESCYQRALMIYEKVFGAEYPHPRIAQVLRDYAVILKQTKRRVESTELETRAETLKAIYTQENATESRSSV